MKLWLNQQEKTSLVSSPLSPACRAHQQEFPVPGSLGGPDGGGLQVRIRFRQSHAGSGLAQCRLHFQLIWIVFDSLKKKKKKKKQWNPRAAFPHSLTQTMKSEVITLEQAWGQWSRQSRSAHREMHKVVFLCLEGDGSMALYNQTRQGVLWAEERDPGRRALCPHSGSTKASPCNQGVSVLPLQLDGTVCIHLIFITPEATWG